MYDRILVPLDGSPLGEQVLPYVTKISLGLGIPVHLIQIFPSVSEATADPIHGRYQTGITQGVRDETIDYLNGTLSKSLGIEITSEAFEGNAADHIIDEAGKSPDSLIAMCTHGRSGVSRWVMGSVTDKVLHSTKNAMLIVRGVHEGEPDPEPNLDTVIVPIDGSPLAEKVIPHVVALAKGLGLNVTLVRVAATAESFSAATGYERLEGVAGIHFPSFEEMAKEAGDQALTYLQALEESIREQGVFSVDHQIIRGSAANAIVDLAQETPNNLVAMTTHGRSGPARWTMGSVTDRVVRHSGDPVLVVRVD